jgi:hypothetical protein
MASKVNAPPSRGLPPRIYIPIIAVFAIVFLGGIGYFLRIGLGVTGSALGPTAQAPAEQGDARIRQPVPPVPTRAPGEAAVPQSGGVPGSAAGALPPGQSVGGGGPAAGPPAPVVQMLGDLRARLAKNPRDREALLQLASLYAEANKFSQAVPLYAQAVALDPNDADARTKYARALFDEGTSASGAGRRSDAIAAFRKFLVVTPDDPRAEDARTALRRLGAS